MRKLLLLTAAVLVLAGCAGPQVNWNDPAAVAPKVTTSRDDFKKITYWNGPAMEQRRQDFTYSYVHLRAFRADSSGETSYQIYVADRVRSDWRFYDQIHDSEGVALQTTQIDRKVDTCQGGVCWMWEDVAANVDRAYLQKHAQEGLRVQLSGRGGKVVVSVPAAYIQAFLSKVPQ